MDVTRPLPTMVDVGHGSVFLLVGDAGAGPPLRRARVEIAGRRTALEVRGRTFWGNAVVPAGAEGDLVVRVVADRRDGTSTAEPIATVTARPQRPIDAAASQAARQLDVGPVPDVWIAMATHAPPPDLLRRQLDSIRRQEDVTWRCVISDDASPDPRVIVELVGDDPRFIVVPSNERLGVVGAFERALRLVPATAPLIALSDQDDEWQPTKLARLRRGLGHAALVHGDARVVRTDGTEIAPSAWRDRESADDTLLSLLLRNQVTGATSLFRSRLLDLALPVPTHDDVLHDHWLALVAAATGGVTRVTGVVQDYVQHDSNAHGHRAARARSAPSRRSLAGIARSVADWQRAYEETAALRTLWTVLEERLDATSSDPVRPELRSMLHLSTSPHAFARVALRAAASPEAAWHLRGAAWHATIGRVRPPFPISGREAAR